MGRMRIIVKRFEEKLLQEVLKMEIISTCSIIVSAVAAGFIAWYAVANHKLANAIKAKDEQHQQELSDLYQAIVLSNLTNQDESIAHSIDDVGRHYTGKTIIIKGLIPKDNA